MTAHWPSGKWPFWDWKVVGSIPSWVRTGMCYLPACDSVSIRIGFLGWRSHVIPERINTADHRSLRGFEQIPHV